MTVVGGVVGLTAAWALSRLAQSLLYQMSGSDPIVLGGRPPRWPSSHSRLDLSPP